MIDPQFLSSTLANAVGGFAAGAGVLIACAASKKLASAVIRWRASRFPEGPDAKRAQEELLGVVDELHAAERAELSAHLCLRSAELGREIAERVAEARLIKATEELAQAKETQRLMRNRRETWLESWRRLEGQRETLAKDLFPQGLHQFPRDGQDILMADSGGAVEATEPNNKPWDREPWNRVPVPHTTTRLSFTFGTPATDSHGNMKPQKYTVNTDGAHVWTEPAAGDSDNVPN